MLSQCKLENYKETIKMISHFQLTRMLYTRENVLFCIHSIIYTILYCKWHLL